jgi:hypothetical protein
MAAKKSREKSANATKHGAYASAVLLPHENPREYARLVIEMRREWQPIGPTEEGLVDRLIDLQWRQKRLRKYEQQLLQARIEDVQKQNQFVPLRADIKALAREFAGATTVDEVEKLLAKHGMKGEIITVWVPKPNESEKQAEWGTAIAEHLKKMDVGTIVEGPSEITTYVDPWKLELQEDRMERLDERILQVTKRLVQIKASKELFRTRPDPERLIPVNKPSRLAATVDQKTWRVQGSDEEASPARWYAPGPVDYARTRVNDSDPGTGKPLVMVPARTNDPE